MPALLDFRRPLVVALRRDPDRLFVGLRVAVLIPCFNEETAVARVVADFRVSLPAATIYVYDNNSRDRTAAVAGAAGALVRNERLQGKGHVVRRMFADIEADVFVLVDGDDTYEANAAPDMVRMLVEQQLDMVTAARETETQDAFRRGHRMGNAMLSGMVRWIFGNRVTDVLSGYRAFSRRFVNRFRRSPPGLRPRRNSRFTRWNSGCRSARRRHAIAHGRPVRSRNCARGPTGCGSFALSSCW